MASSGRNQGFRMMEELTCEAISEVNRSHPGHLGRGVNPGMRLAIDTVFQGDAPTAGRTAELREMSTSELLAFVRLHGQEFDSQALRVLLIEKSMADYEADLRSPQRRARDEQIASEMPIPPLDVPLGVIPSAVEAHFASRLRPLAVAGVVENGLIRLLDPNVKLPERSRVIIVAAEG